MGLFDVVTKPISAAVDAGKAVVDKVEDVGSAVVDKVEDAGSAVVDSAKDAAESVANADGWAGLAWRLNPITGPVLQGVDTINAVKDLAQGKEGASIWDIPALGFAKGVGEGAVDLVKGVGYLGLTSIKSSPLRAIVDPEGFHEQWKQNAETLKFVAEHPGDVLKGIVAPITEDVEGGRYYEVEGRGAFEVLNVIFGAKGANKLAEAVGLTGKAAEGAGAAGRVGEVIADGADDAGRAAEAAGTVADDAGRAAEAAGTVADDAGRAAKLLDDIAPGLTSEERAFAQQLDVEHLFRGDAEGGVHWAAGPGEVEGGAIVEEVGTVRPNATWKAKVTINGETKTSTMFPREWSPEEVIRAVKSALEDGRASGNVVTSRISPTAEEVTGTYRGIKIKVVVEQDGSIVTAFPKQEGKVFTP